MQKIIIGVALAALLTAPVWAGGNRESEPEEEPVQEAPAESDEELVARVNGTGVPRAEFDELLESNIARYEAESGEQFPQEQRSQLMQRILEGLITRTVLEVEAERRGITLSTERFEQSLAQFKGQFPSEDAYRQALQQQGFTEARFEQELERQLLIEELIDTEAVGDLSVGEPELRAFYEDNPEYFERPEQVSARHIIMSTQGINDEAELNAKMDRLREIRERLLDGESFEELAREYSEGPSAPEGGRLGTFGRGQMVPEFENVAFEIEVGEISEIVETQFGYHVLQVTERMPAQVVGFDDVRDNIEEFLLEDTRNQVAQEYVQNLRQSADVEILIDL